MTFTNSSLVVYTKLSPNHSGQRTRVIDRITPHCVVGQVTAESLGAWFEKKSTKASSNYGIDKDGRVALYVEEKNRSWCSSSAANDQRAVTIECASDTEEPYAFRDVVYQKLITLCVDICRRNGKKKLLWIEDKAKSLTYKPKDDEMILTVHRWFSNMRTCPGTWMYSRMGELAEKVTSQLQSTATASTPTPAKTEGVPFLVRVKIYDLYIRSGPGIYYTTRGFIPAGAYTIVETRTANGLEWGRLKSGAGWICLKYAERI